MTDNAARLATFSDPVLLLPRATETSSHLTNAAKPDDAGMQAALKDTSQRQSEGIFLVGQWVSHIGMASRMAASHTEPTAELHNDTLVTPEVWPRTRTRLTGPFGHGSGDDHDYYNPE